MSIALEIENLSLHSVPFATETLQKFDDRKVKVTQTTRGTVNLHLVVGTWHIDYAGHTWGELKPAPGTLQGNITDPATLKQGLKRAYSNLKALDQNPDYYESDEIKEHWTFYLVDGKYYVLEGNNRTVIARYYFFLKNKEPLVKGVVVHKAEWIVVPPKTLPQRLIRYLRDKFIGT